MPIITKPGTVEKGAEAVFTLDKSALAALPVVSGDDYFSVITNWSKVEMFFKSPVGNQMEVVAFDPSQASPSGKFLVSETARDIFEIEKIIIFDFDGGNFLVKREDLTVAEFDMDFAAPPSPVITFDGKSNASYISFPEAGKVVRLIPSGNEAALSRYWFSEAITGDFTFTATVKAGNIGENPCQALFGLSDSLPLTNTYALKSAGWGLIFYDYGVVKPWDQGGTETTWSRGSSYEIEVKRVSGVVSYKVGGFTFSYTLNTSASVYLVGCLQVGFWEVSNASLVLP